MDITILLTIISGLIVTLLFGFLYLKTRGEKKERQPRPQGAPGPRRAVGARNARARLRAAVAARNNEDLDEEDAEEDRQPGRAVEDLEFDEKIGAKKRAKLEAKAERKAQREFQERKREEDKKKKEKLEEERRRAEQKEEEEEKRRLEEEKRIREEKARIEHEEYLKIKEQFVVEEEGFEEMQEDDGNLLQKFISYIKDNKVVVLEDLAAHFKLKTQNVIDRIATLQAEGILTGVIDDRGKFIYVQQKELEAVAKFVKQRGRVSLTELVENSNRLVNVTPVVSA